MSQADLEVLDRGRRLFAYLSGGEWQEYRAILSVFADTYFAEFTPEDVAERLAELDDPALNDRVALEAATVADRLESLRRWGNLDVSASVGNPTSLTDYYRRRNRYLITPAGQAAYVAVESVLGRVDEVQDVSASRLRSLLTALRALRDLDIERADPELLADRVSDVFSPHEAFTSEITLFFASLNQWQNRFDLTHEELAVFAQALVGYVADQLDEIHRVSEPIASTLDDLTERIPTIVARASRGLAGRIEEAGVANAFVVTHRAGSDLADWDHLRSWFALVGGRPSRLRQLRGDAIAAIRTLTLNLSRLSNIGLGGASRRADLIRFAGLIDRSDPRLTPRLVQAGFGLGRPIHWGTLSADAHDPVAGTTPWAEAPPATVPVSLRERGERQQRGASSPLPDRTAQQRMIQMKRQAERDRLRRIDDELVDACRDGEFADVEVSIGALHRLQGLVGAALAQMGPTNAVGEKHDGALRCRVERRSGHALRVSTPDGTLTFADLTVRIDVVAEAQR